VGTALDTPVPAALLDLPLTDQRGHHLTLGSFSGKFVVVSDVLTLCQETCAIGTASMLQAARTVDRAGLGDKVEFLSITIDPRRDDQRHLAAYQRLFGALPNWELATGSAADINRLWDKLGVWRRTVSLSPPYPRDWLTSKPLTVDIQHSDDLIFIGPDARFRFLIDGPGAVGAAKSIPSTILGFMDRLGHKNVTNPDAGSWSASDVVAVLRWLAGAGTSA
jgi:protein SCO1/2